ncbi:MAG: hypothetical protein RL226_33, partial [Bacteroidota bacterium]
MKFGNLAESMGKLVIHYFETSIP